ncbi:MAG: hypothetical protein KJ907_13765 [Actinobacteria bacterium]|nr:hypothetical protein [Actinomycetota bacterium]MBU4403785.1 hypothetical protein [Actinomycetota bacterium]MCG2819289.1 hypothetical protein [Actinomycetes bacterium]
MELVKMFGGEASASRIARRQRWSPNYGRCICNSLARRDYLDLLKEGWARYRLTPQGELALVERGIA